MNFDEGEDEAEGWLVSYADLMTLIACFFILMMAFANYDPPGFQQKVEVVAKHFKDKNETSDMNATDAQAQKQNDDVDKSKDEEKSKGEMAQLKETLESRLEIKKMTKIEVENKELIINFNGNILFESGFETIKEMSVAMLDAMISIVKEKNPNYRIIIEGHTDDEALGSGAKFRSNWALSGARAASVAERFELYGFPPENIKILGLGSSTPILPNRDKNGEPLYENMKQNRRVVVKIVEPIGEVKKVKLGLGVYFED